jgi:outer membrane receptor protein involved in Fe transport
MKTLLIKILFLLLFPFGTLLATETESNIDAGVKGIVKDSETRQGLEYATVMIYNAADSSFAGGGITSVGGAFDISLKPGRYYAMVQFLAYNSITLNDIIVGRGRSGYDIGELLLSPDAGLLDEVEVIAERSQVEMSLDKRVFNVGRDITSVATNAIDVLENVPSVTVDVEGNVSLRGDDGVRILIDGKMSGLAGLSSRDALRSLPADMIERIEIVTNPSVRYDAEGSSGIINIVLKRDRRRGFNGSFDLSGGYPLQAGISGSLNYRLPKFNFFANYSLNYREMQGSGNVYREFYRPEGTFITRQESTRDRYSLGNTIRLGVEYNINPNSSLTLSGLYRYSDQNGRSRVMYNDFFPAELLINQTKRVERNTSLSPVMEYNMLYRREFRKKDQLFTASVRYMNNVDDQRAEISEEMLFDISGILAEDIFQQTLNDEKQSSFEIEVDYFHPFNGNAKMETGFKSQIREIDNDYAVEEKDESGSWIDMPQFTNHFIYNENIYAAYVLFGNDVGKYSYQLGVRSEFSDIRTRLINSNEDNQNTYIDFFPSGHFTYKLSETQHVQLSYSRRIRRPGFRQLNPFRSFSDNRNVWSGNPNLQPVYTNSYELGYLKFWQRSSFNGSIYYRDSRNVFQRVERIDSTGIIYIRPENFATNQSFGLELIGSTRILKWWNVNGSVNFFRSITEGSTAEQDFKTDSYSWSGRVNNRFTIQRGFDFQLSGNFRGPREMPQGKRKANWSVDAGLSKEVLKGNGTITLNVRDVFSTRKWAFETFGLNYYTDSEFQWMPTSISVNFNYRINQNQQQRRQQERRGQQQNGDVDDNMMEF